MICYLFHEFVFLSLAPFLCCMHVYTQPDSGESILSLCCLTSMFYRWDHTCGVAFEEQVMLWKFVLPHCFFFQFKGKLWLYNYFFNRCRPLCLGYYLLSSLLRFSLIFGELLFFFFTYSCSTLACLRFLLSCVSLWEVLTEVTFFLLLTLED